MKDRLNLDDIAVDQLKVHQEGIVAIRDELDDRTETYKTLDEAVQAGSDGIDRRTVERKLKSEDIRNLSESDPDRE